MNEEITFVTGATGFIGSHVVRRLLLRGDRVRVLVRGSSPRSNIEALGCEIVIGDLKDSMSLLRCVQGCRRVYHVAADYRLWARNPQEIYDNNVGGTRNLLSACCEAGVEKVVYTSSVGTIGMQRNGVPAIEDTPVKLDDMIGHYKRSKFMAEQVAREFAASGLPVVIVNPTTPIGAGDIKPTPTGKIILDFLRGRLPAYVETGLNLVAVEDVAEGHLLAETRGRVGERYLLGGENWSLKEILNALAEICGRRPPRFRIPWTVALMAGTLDDFVTGTLLRREPSIPLEGVRMSRYKMYVSCEKARRELGYNPRPVEQALRAAVDYFRYDWQPAAAHGRVSKMRSDTI
ncbi:MAG: NAD-dependent epimerase/dehydratase family protein [Acidobacteriota bacterium]|jgi:dihydroflavonol-4-reductase|nr:NAD-dependent epimerase/dehydratase family protein [Acidobacteriota bacterium]NLT34014.1 NAD-dependent epimerase/dehydratase family protein [Acidobacteriota bacterium]